jgi:hypothetical protein
MSLQSRGDVIVTMHPDPESLRRPPSLDDRAGALRLLHLPDLSAPKGKPRSGSSRVSPEQDFLVPSILWRTIPVMGQQFSVQIERGLPQPERAVAAGDDVRVGSDERTPAPAGAPGAGVSAFAVVDEYRHSIIIQLRQELLHRRGGQVLEHLFADR